MLYNSNIIYYWRLCMDWQEIWNNIKNFFTSNVWNAVIFFAILIIGIIVVKITLNISRRFLQKTRLEKVAQTFMYHIIKFALYLILMLILLKRLGVNLTGLLTAISAMVLAIGMALQNIIANIANGMVIVSSKMFKQGDYVSVLGVEGHIDYINFLFTTIITLDNKRVTIPNSSILNNPVTNYGSNPTRRIDLYFEVAYESDVELVKKVVTDVMKSNGKVIVDPEPPFCRLRILDSSGIKFFAYCWVDGEDYWDVYYYLMENVFNEFKRHNISIPFSQVEIRERKDEVVMPVVGEGLQERQEKVRIRKKKIDLESDDLLAMFNKNRKKRDRKKNTPKQDKE